MFKNNLKLALRNIKRYKGYSIINIFGLAIGMSCCILILLWIQSELTFDNFHKNGHSIYRIVSNSKYWQGFWGTPAPLASTIKDEIPGVANYCRIAEHSKKIFQYKDKKFYENSGFLVDPSFFEIFTFQFMYGNSQNVFSQPHDIVITQELAKKYFAEENPIGKNIEVDGVLKTVKGVIKNIPANSHLQFDYLSSFQYIL